MSKVKVDEAIQIAKDLRTEQLHVKEKVQQEIREIAAIVSRLREEHYSDHLIERTLVKMKYSMSIVDTVMFILRNDISIVDEDYDENAILGT